MVDLSDNVGRYVSITYRHMAAKIAKKLAPYGIGSGQAPIMFALFIEDGHSQQTLADKLAMDKAAVTRAISRLEDAGYIKRVADAGDRRSYNIFLTQKGKNLRQNLENAVLEILDILQTDMSENERETAKNLLRKMAWNISGCPRIKL